MSVEVLRGEALSSVLYLPNGMKSGRRHVYFHDIVHDMESFFWVMVHTCLTREGPSQPRQPDSREGEVNNILRILFDSEDKNVVANTRARYLKSIQFFETEVIPCFAPYFQPLKELAMKWLWTLQNAYKFRAIEYHEIHYIVVAMLQEMIQKLQVDAAADGFKARRSKEWMNLRKFPKGTSLADEESGSS